MSVKKHPNYKEEKNRLEYTKEYIKATLNATEEYRKLYKENIKDAMVNLDFLDSSQSYINIILNTKFLEMAERNFDALEKSKDKPYFARIDFKSKDKEDIEKLYIGKTSLFRSEDEIPLITDWRSPIANIYYEGRLGEVSYETELGIQKGELSLKRQYIIENGEIESILDIDITTNDAFLQASLEANADKRLKDIASTIQSEQNRVIRAKMNKPLIVQGVAGSGKTTIALHRIAYFIYTYEKVFNPENFMIIAPNNLFINYISEVLPELGVEKVKQTTLIDFMIELIGKKYKMIPSSEKLMDLIYAKDEKEKHNIKWSASFKGSLDFKDIIDNYTFKIEENFVPKKDFSIENQVIVSKEDVKNMFLKDLKHLPLYKRINEIKKSLSNRLKLIKKDILKQIEEHYDKQIDYIRESIPQSEERRLKIVSLIDERDDKLIKTTNQIKTLVKKYISLFPKKDLYEYYKELITIEDNIHKFSTTQLPKEEVAFLCNISEAILFKKKIELEDYAPLVYLKHKLFGFDKKISVNSVVMDEAQDFSLFQLYTLKKVLNTNMFTLLGDLSQGIHSYRSIQNWEEVIENVFGKEKSNYMTLVQSYRTTIEIMNLANEVIKKLNNKGIVLAKPVIRHGEKPSLRTYNQVEEMIKELEEKIKEKKNQGYKSIALICKTIEECIKLRKYLDKNNTIDTKIMNEKEDNYEAGVIIIPSHLAKGLEFDTVFVVNMQENYMDTDLDIKLLYVAMTRSLHELHIYQIKNEMSLLNNIDDTFFNI